MDEKEMVERLGAVEEGLKAIKEMLADMPPTLGVALDLHEKWVNGEENGERLDLSGVDLTGVKMQNAILSKADLSGTTFSDANMRDTDFTGADLGHTMSKQFGIGSLLSDRQIENKPKSGDVKSSGEGE